ncbi:MAG: 16S rRNA (guanine(527)-N(7))-methyltransferase RsmG [Clostridia bacterium]|nr:16S rRNA (guanine(527)-N(7))-methyltransferase RsmG [Clostridia bacterium]
MQQYLNEILVSQLDLHLTEEQLQKMEQYWQSVKSAPLNLTSIKEDRDAAVLHFADSLALLHFFNLPLGASLIDVGTGGGFPSVPLSIARADLKVTAIDATAKKLSFIRSHTEPEQISLIHARAEELGRDPAYREQFQYAVARAVAPANVLLEYLSPFIVNHGYVIIYKSELSDEELSAADAAAQILRLKRTAVEHYELRGTDVFRRTLIAYRKSGSTPSRYPRRQVRNQPLGQ